MQAVFEAAGEQRCSRVEWTMDTGNAGARAFHHQLGHPDLPAALRALAARGCVGGSELIGLDP